MEETEIEAKFKVGDRVATKKTGLPAIGSITSVLDATYFINNFNVQTRLMINAKWKSIYTDWLKKPVYNVSFEKPQKYCTLEEMKSGLPKIFHDFYDINALAEDLYKTEVGDVYFAAYPEDDLELL